MNGYPGRRRLLKIVAAGAGWSFSRASFASEVVRPAARRHSWRGIALGADAQIALLHADRDVARAILAKCVAEIDRIESLFSLFRPESAIVRLNTSGRLEGAPALFLQVVDAALALAHRSGGRFDPTVQPLWELYARHFGGNPADGRGPPRAAIDSVRARLGHSALMRRGSSVWFGREDMAITLNGIAQGFLTDRIVAILKESDLPAALVETGETYALGRHPSGRRWRIGLRNPLLPGLIGRTIALEDRALATSAGYGTRFDRAGRFHHIFDPLTARSVGHYLAVSVTASTAMAADALSTALYAMPLADARYLVDGTEGCGAWFTLPDGTIVAHGATREFDRLAKSRANLLRRGAAP